ncbi:MAG: hypothetical protein AAFX05_08905 [Planctomycetota bacterium]
MRRRVPVTTIACCYALGAFAIAILSGLRGDRPADAVLESALLAMLVCYFVGLVVAQVAAVVVREHIDRFERENDVALPDASVSVEQPAPEQA